MITCATHFILQLNISLTVSILTLSYTSLVPRHTRGTRKWAWWHLANSCMCWSQQSWFRVGESRSFIANYNIVITFFTLWKNRCSSLHDSPVVTPWQGTFYLAITNSYLPHEFECIQVRNVIAYAVMLIVHIREFCQVSPGPLPRSVCGPGYEASPIHAMSQKSNLIYPRKKSGAAVDALLLWFHPLKNKRVPHTPPVNYAQIQSTRLSYCL